MASSIDDLVPFGFRYDARQGCFAMPVIRLPKVLRARGSLLGENWFRPNLLKVSNFQPAGNDLARKAFRPRFGASLQGEMAMEV